MQTRPLLKGNPKMALVLPEVVNNISRRRLFYDKMTKGGYSIDLKIPPDFGLYVYISTPMHQDLKHRYFPCN